ncbi:MAG: Fic family protein [Anaerolineales bacterium]|nr:Fic family protein [Anaerolineales bacterium]
MDPKDYVSKRAGELIRVEGRYWAFLPAGLPPALDWSPAIITAMGEAERALGRMDSLALTLPAPRILVRPFVRREAVLSSRIEGTRASLSDVYTYEAARLSFLAPSSDAGEVHDYVKALDHALGRLTTARVSLGLLQEVHATLMAGSPESKASPGKFRSRQNWIGYPGSTLQTASYIPPPVADLHEGLSSLERFITGPSDLPPLIRSALIHYQFEALHPFMDGNGRIGRLLVILLLMEWGLLTEPLLYLSAFFEARRLEYYERLLRVSQRGEWESWIAFFLWGVKSQSEDAIGRIEGLLRLQKTYQEKLKGERAFSRLQMALEVLFERPVVTIRQLQKALGVPYRTAQRYVEKLESFGILREVTGRARNKIYQADEVLSAIDEPLDQD